MQRLTHVNSKLSSVYYGAAKPVWEMRANVDDTTLFGGE